MFRDSSSTGIGDRFLLATISLTVVSLLWLAALPGVSMSAGEARARRQTPHLPAATAVLKPRDSADGTIAVAAPRRALAKDGAGRYYLVVVQAESTRREFVTVGAIREGYATVSGPTIRVGDRVRLTTLNDPEDSMQTGVGE